MEKILKFSGYTVFLKLPLKHCINYIIIIPLVEGDEGQQYSLIGQD